MPDRRFFSRALLALLYMMMVTATSAQLVQAQATGEKTAAHTPGSTIAIISAWPRKLASKQRMQLAPLEVITAAGIEQIGVDPLKIERFDFMLGMPGIQGPVGGALIQFSEPVRMDQFNPQLFDGAGLQNENDLEFQRLQAPFETIVHLLDDQTLIVGTAAFARQMIAPGGQPSRVGNIVAQVKSEQDMMAIVSVSTLRPLILGVLEGQARDLPPPVAMNVSQLVESTDFAAVRLIIGESDQMQLVLSGNDASGADTIEQSLQEIFEFAKESAVAEFKSQIPRDTPTGDAMHQYIDRLSGELMAMITPRRSGNRLILEAEEFQNMSVIGTMVGLLLPAVQASREAARRMHSSNNLKQIGLAMHNFADTYRAFPATAGLDDEGNPLISWRVAILPFIEEQELYERFRLDEPWDSEHNIQLLEEMPDVYKHPSRPTQPGHTVYQAPVSDESLLRLTEPTRFADITDGTSNTIMILETAADVAVPWTAPEDYEIDEDDPGANLFVNRITQAVFGDGSVRVLAETIDANVLRALFTRAGGEVVPAL